MSKRKIGSKRKAKKHIQVAGPSSETLSKYGAKGGKETFKEHGAEHFRKISLMRKTFGGGRPKKAKSA